MKSTENFQKKLCDKMYEAEERYLSELDYRSDDDGYISEISLRENILALTDFFALTETQAKALLKMRDPLGVIVKDCKRLGVYLEDDIWDTVKARADMEIDKQKYIPNKYFDMER